MALENPFLTGKAIAINEKYVEFKGSLPTKHKSSSRHINALIQITKSLTFSMRIKSSANSFCIKMTDDCVLRFNQKDI